jgi:hypothetical protein
VFSQLTLALPLGQLLPVMSSPQTEGLWPLEHATPRQTPDAHEEAPAEVTSQGSPAAFPVLLLLQPSAK